MSLPLASTVLALPGLPKARVELTKSPITGLYGVLVGWATLVYSTDVYADALRRYRAEVDRLLDPSI